MKAILLISMLFFSHANAATRILFSNDKAVVVIQGPAGDLDARKLFDVMIAPAIDDGAASVKHLSFATSTKQNVFDLVCKLSKTVANYGSCTLKIFKLNGTVFDPGKKRVISSIQDLSEVNRVSQLFAVPDQDGSIYFSSNLNLGISLHAGGGSLPQLFMIQYSEEH